ncbi:PREDICTED: ubiquitin-conjugating enzyme E2 W isoform X6 [Chinchilla lanigera]|uniref:ubiquitin-conjugating enzyme E2 W isoform X6 n=1 Tax=Chinchilla lanigera TaxID=34839 RepID=UPI000695ACE8|nr:PREDICTED: ubiquitin-conjugating enzyme E2 W isoform X6 [Chinchilla lanigera]
MKEKNFNFYLSLVVVILLILLRDDRQIILSTCEHVTRIQRKRNGGIMKSYNSSLKTGSSSSTYRHGLPLDLQLCLMCPKMCSVTGLLATEYPWSPVLGKEHILCLRWRLRLHWQKKHSEKFSRNASSVLLNSQLLSCI